MAALTADDVNITIVPEDVDFTHQLRKMNVVSITFGDGSKTYPTGGVPLPDKARFGTGKDIRFMSIAQPLNGYVYAYDRTNHKLKIFYCDYDASSDGALIEVPSTHAPAATTLEALVLGE